MKKILLIASFITALFSTDLSAQTVLYNENFDAANHLPTGWYATAASWDTTAGNPDTIAGSTGAGHMVIRNATGVTGYDSLITRSISTTNYNTISVKWAVRNTSHFADSGSTIMGLYYSINNGSTWAQVTYTENPNNSIWSWANGGTSLALPAAAANQANLKLMWVANLHSNSKGTYGIDDLSVSGTAIPSAVDEIGNAALAHVYANSGRVYISQTSHEPVLVEMISLTGQLIYTSTINTPTAVISSESFSKGIYFVRVSNSDHSSIAKIVLQ